MYKYIWNPQTLHDPQREIIDLYLKTRIWTNAKWLVCACIVFEECFAFVWHYGFADLHIAISTDALFFANKQSLLCFETWTKTLNIYVSNLCLRITCLQISVTLVYQESVNTIPKCGQPVRNIACYVRSRLLNKPFKIRAETDHYMFVVFMFSSCFCKFPLMVIKQGLRWIRNFDLPPCKIWRPIAWWDSFLLHIMPNREYIGNPERGGREQWILGRRKACQYLGH